MPGGTVISPVGYVTLRHIYPLEVVVTIETYDIT